MLLTLRSRNVAVGFAKPDQLKGNGKFLKTHKDVESINAMPYPLPQRQ
jgi:hypothetical protein